MDSTNFAVKMIQQGQPIIPEELIKKFEYCSSSASKHVIEKYVFDGLTPERDARTALLQIHSKLGALMDLYYSESKRERDIKRTHIKIKQIQREMELDIDPLKRDLLKLEIEDLTEDILKIEDQRRLTKPLLKDAEAELELYMQILDKLQENLRGFEEAESEFFYKKAAQEVKLEAVAGMTGLSKSTLESLQKLAPQTIESLVPPQVSQLLSNVEINKPMQLEAPQDPNLLETTTSSNPTRDVTLVVPTDDWALAPLGPLAMLTPDSQLHLEKAPMTTQPNSNIMDALTIARTVKTPWFVVFINREIILEEHALLKAFDAFHLDETIDFVGIDVPGKYGTCPGRFATPLGDLPGVIIGRTADLNRWLEKGLEKGQSLPTIHMLKDVGVAQFDFDTGAYWRTKEFEHPAFDNVVS